MFETNCILSTKIYFFCWLFLCIRMLSVISYLTNICDNASNLKILNSSKADGNDAPVIKGGYIELNSGNPATA